MLKQRLKGMVRVLSNAVTISPMECIMALVAVGIGMINIYHSVGNEYRLLYYPVLFLVANISNKLTVEGRRRWSYYVVSLLLLAILILFNVKPSNSYYIVALGCVSLAYFSFPMYADNDRFGENVLNNIVAILFAGFVSGVVFLLTISIKFSLTYLFGLRDSWKDLDCIAMLVWVGLFPILFLAFNNNNLRLRLKNKFTEILFNYILTPAIIVYMLIFYAYFVKVIILWELPKGNVAYMVFGFGIAAYLLKMISFLLAKDYFVKLYRNLAYFVLPSLVLFWIGTIYRVNEYGFTEERIYLLIGGVFLTAASLVLISQNRGRYLYLSLGVIVLLLVFTYLPFISAKTLGIKSQEHRFEKALRMLGYTKLDTTVRFKPLANTPLNRKAISTLVSSFDYVYYQAQSGYTAKHLGIESTYQLEKIVTPVNYAIAFKSKQQGSSVDVLRNPNNEVDIQGYKKFILLHEHSKDGTYYNNDGSMLSIYYNNTKIFSANKDSLLNGQLAKAGINLHDVPDGNKPLSKKQQLLYRIEIPGGVALVTSYYISEQPYKVDDIYLYGMLLNAD